MSAIEALQLIFPDSSKRTLNNWLRAKRFSIDGKPLNRANLPLTEGQLISSKDSCRPAKVPGVPILYEDRYLIVIDKPKGLLSVPLDEETAHRHALGLLRHHFQTDQIYAVHRIDRETSGVLLFARGKESQRRLKEMFESHNLKRQYFAIVEGKIKEDEGVWDAPLKELPSFSVIPDTDGKAALTRFSVLRRSAKYSYLKLELETGRKHQIRVHCKIAGHPILGDSRYGSAENPIGRLCLHASLLELTHPFTGKILRFTSPIPPQFKSLVTKSDLASTSKQL